MFREIAHAESWVSQLRREHMSRSRHLVMREAHALLDSFGSALNAENVAGLRAMMQGLIESMPPPAADGVKIEERRIPGAAGAPPVRVLVYTPPGLAGPLPVHLDIHGGGYIAGSADIDAVLCRQLCVAVGCAVVSVDYRLAPEVRYPGALEDCYAALQWVHREGAALGFDTTRITCGGESAGGGHCAALAILVRERGGPKILLQLLGQPMLDDRTGSTSKPHPYTGEFVWTADLNRIGWASLLGVEAGSAAVPARAVPARVEDLTGLPPAFIVIGALDLFVEETIEYARRLMRAGVPTELHVLPGAFHGSASLVPGAAVSVAYFQLQYDALKHAFSSAR
jgi:acetyl esterase/lipase